MLKLGSAAFLGLLVVPSVAAAAEPLLTPARIFGDAAPLQKVVILTLVIAIVAAVGIAFAAAAKGYRGGAAFVSNLRVGGPLVGLFGAVYSSLNSFIGLSNAPATTPFSVIWPGVAESLFAFALGLLAAIAAVIAQWAIEVRTSRAAAGAP